VILPRATLGSYGSLEEQGHPGWDLSRDPALVEKHAKGRDVALVLRCNCGKVIRLLDHRIAADGTLSPSIWHDIPGCGWHVFGKLQGWDGVEWDVGK
jgi:hypothetical protein